MKNVQYYTLIIGLLFVFSSCTKHYHVSRIEPNSIKTTDALDEDASVEEMIAPYKKEMEEEMEVKIGELAIMLEKAKPESTLGNFVADLIHKKCEDYYKQPIDFAVVNYGGLRIPSIPAGAISKSKVFELMPFDNMLVVVEVDGVTMLQLFKTMADKGGWPISKHVSYEIEGGTAQKIMINNEPLDLARSYKVAISDYLANGGDRLSFLIDKPRTNLDVLFRDAILQYIVERKGAPIRAEIEGRVVKID